MRQGEKRDAYPGIIKEIAKCRIRKKIAERGVDKHGALHWVGSTRGCHWREGDAIALRVSSLAQIAERDRPHVWNNKHMSTGRTTYPALVKLKHAQCPLSTAHLARFDLGDLT